MKKVMLVGCISYVFMCTSLPAFSVFAEGSGDPAAHEQSESSDKQKQRIPEKFYQDDENGDLKVSKDEFSGPEEHFSRMDLDKDGYISEKEAAQKPPREGGRK